MQYWLKLIMKKRKREFVFSPR